ncbi:MAG: non-canonical purine NTP pyrophosphatase, partial [Gemmatimonadota bacterium]
KRFAGLDGPDHVVTPANNAHMLEQLRDVPPERRTARYRSVLVLTGVGDGDLVAEGTNEGRILLEPRGINGFGYDPYFFCDELGKTFGEATAAEKAAVSHRARAAAALVARLA